LYRYKEYKSSQIVKWDPLFTSPSLAAGYQRPLAGRYMRLLADVQLSAQGR
jgi:hypothetical protein